MKIPNRVLFAIAILAMFTLPAFAQLDGNPPNFCRNGFFPRENADFRLANIVGKAGEKVYFYGDERDDCPAAKNCRLKSYVIPGDEVIVSRSLGDYSCVWFQPRTGYETVSWIPTANLKVKSSPAVVGLNAFIGEWNFYENSITIKPTRRAGTLSVRGNAFWKGLGDNVHIGEIEEDVAPQKSTILIGAADDGEYACKATLRLLGRYLIVGDNLNCGGANVTFTGIYRKN